MIEEFSNFYQYLEIQFLALIRRFIKKNRFYLKKIDAPNPKN